MLLLPGQFVLQNYRCYCLLAAIILFFFKIPRPPPTSPLFPTPPLSGPPLPLPPVESPAPPRLPAVVRREEHAEQPAVGNGAAASDGEPLRARPGPDSARHPVPDDAR